MSPIVLFVYNRPKHLLLCLESLLLCKESVMSTLIFFCDGIKEDASLNDIKKISEVRNIVKNYEWPGKKIIFDSEINKGLAESVIYGLNYIFESHDRAIVLEDDLIVSSGFLTYMNTALEKYKSIKIIKQISGFQFPIQDVIKNNQSFFLPITTTWGWGTWRRAWTEVDFNPKDHILLSENKELCFRFNIMNSYNYAGMLNRQMAQDKFGSWGIRFYWHVFKTGGLSLFPDYSLVQHLDLNFSGTHPTNFSQFNYKSWISNYSVINFPEKIEVKYSFIIHLAKFLNEQKNITSRFIYLFKYINTFFIKATNFWFPKN
jgi:hypothetical protein